MGLIVGTLTHLCILMYKSTRPRVLIDEGRIDGVSYHLVIPDRALFFPSVDDIRTRLGEVAAMSMEKGGLGAEDVEGVSTSSSKESAIPWPIIVDMSRVVEMDFTAAAVSAKNH